ncbi:conserved hypothetical protein [Ricinus communis]|uniref:DUF506 domain-containing protein n=2 Tax=Ricinus communis TaxID=3988 RepID=B9RXD1_RICCO|nr:conserved hypothetical protein [Ricinus communis]|eukprot:XP_002518400.1 uncharacterized protein LOC8277948 [Ricinus communis]
MTKLPVKFKKMAAAMFNEAARLRLCERSGSEHCSPDHDLSQLVNSFIERDDHPTILFMESDIKINHPPDDDNQEHYSVSDAENKNILESLLNKEDDDDVRKKIRSETEIACGIIGERSSHGFHRSLMSHLRHLGFDAGLCKSRWEKFGRYPAGEYQYVDVNVGGNRLIVEVCLAAEFEIARPTLNYTALVDDFPPVFIGKPEEMKQVVRLMCSAIRESMKEMKLHVPPWRKIGYMQAKWFAPYKRTTNENLTKMRSESHHSFATKRSAGFEAFPAKAYHCRDNHIGGGKLVGLKTGYLTAAFNGDI